MLIRTRPLLRGLTIAALGLCSFTTGVVAQNNKLDPTGKAGIGTEGAPGGTQNALHIHFTPTVSMSDTAFIRFSEGTSTTSAANALIGLLPLPADSYYTWLHSGQDFLIRENEGDILITDKWPASGESATYGGAVRIATSPDSTTLATGTPARDFERITVLANGNVGVSVPPDSATGLAWPQDQLQIGGGLTPLDGQNYPIPGLTIYGGTQWEGKTKLVGFVPKVIPYNPRYIGFNYAKEHLVTVDSTYRLARMSGSAITFDPANGGMIQLDCQPYDSARGKNDFRRELHFTFMGNKGLEVWKDVNDSDQNHHLFDAWVPGFPGYNWNLGGDSLRNINGLFVHYTPVLMSATSNWHVPNFTNFAHVHPTLGDGKTWMLAVDGSALVKELLILDTVWADDVFDADYALRPLRDVETFISEHHRLPDVPSADEVKRNGVSVGETDAMLLRKIEELTRYTIALQKQVDALQAKLDKSDQHSEEAER